jgi:hypothetical protein
MQGELTYWQTHMQKHEDKQKGSKWLCTAAPAPLCGAAMSTMVFPLLCAQLHLQLPETKDPCSVNPRFNCRKAYYG